MNVLTLLIVAAVLAGCGEKTEAVGGQKASSSEVGVKKTAGDQSVALKKREEIANWILNKTREINEFGGCDNFNCRTFSYPSDCQFAIAESRSGSVEFVPINKVTPYVEFRDHDLGKFRGYRLYFNCKSGSECITGQTNDNRKYQVKSTEFNYSALKDESIARRVERAISDLAESCSGSKELY